uniref:Remorin C-terminal domain-containing protein n=1 Tax=Oryza rufipogon TaxID=4529 RepID=A0A0E0R132_ORYRU
MAEVAPPAPAPEPTKDIAEERAAVPAPEESKAMTVVDDAEKAAATGGSHERDALLTTVATEKRISLIKAWEENEKAKADNKSVERYKIPAFQMSPRLTETFAHRAAKKLADIASWENSKVAEIKKYQEYLERKKAEQVEKLMNGVAKVHRAAEEKRAATEARRGEEVVKAEEAAAKYRAKGEPPKKLLFG